MDSEVDVFDVNAAYDEYEENLLLYYAYLEPAHLNIDAYLARVRERALKLESEAELRALLQRSMFAFADPHLSVSPREEEDFNVWPTSGDMALRCQDGEFRVVDVRAGSAADLADVRPGWVIEHINGTPLREQVATLLEMDSEPVDLQRGYVATIIVNGKRNGEARTVGFRVEGEPVELVLENPIVLAKQVEERDALEVEFVDVFCIVRILNSLGENETIAAFDEVMKSCAECKGLILDLRNTPSGGNTDVARGIIGHFVKEPRPYQMHEIPAVERKWTVPRRFVEYVLPREPHFAHPVAVLGGRWTGSMGEGTVIGMNAAAGSRTFGSEMGKLLGAVHPIPLEKSDLTLRLGAESLFHVDGTPRGEYVMDVMRPASDRDKDGHDPILPLALAWLSSASQ